MLKTTILFFALFAIFATQSCKKEAIEAPTTAQTTTANFSEIDVQNGILTFETIPAYTAIVDQEDDTNVEELIAYSQKLPFEAYAKQENKPMDFGSEFIEAILNKDRIVKIGKWFIKINVETKRVYALSDEFKGEYPSLLTDNPSNKHIHQFSTDTEVLELLQNEELLNSRGLFCGESGASNHPYTGTLYSTATPTVGFPKTRYSFPCKITYLKLGIYYTLKAEMEAIKEKLEFVAGRVRVTQFLSDIHLRIMSERKYKVRCGASHGWHPVVSLDYDVKLRYRSYQGTKRLNKYWMKIGFDAAFPGSGGYINLAPQVLGGSYQFQIKDGY